MSGRAQQRWLERLFGVCEEMIVARRNDPREHLLLEDLQALQGRLLALLARPNGGGPISEGRTP